MGFLPGPIAVAPANAQDSERLRGAPGIPAAICRQVPFTTRPPLGALPY